MLTKRFLIASNMHPIMQAMTRIFGANGSHIGNTSTCWKQTVPRKYHTLKNHKMRNKFNIRKLELEEQTCHLGTR